MTRVRLQYLHYYPFTKEKFKVHFSLEIAKNSKYQLWPYPAVQASTWSWSLFGMPCFWSKVGVNFRNREDRNLPSLWLPWQCHCCRITIEIKVFPNESQWIFHYLHFFLDFVPHISKFPRITKAMLHLGFMVRGNNENQMWYFQICGLNGSGGLVLWELKEHGNEENMGKSELGAKALLFPWVSLLSKGDLAFRHVEFYIHVYTSKLVTHK